MPTRLLLCLVAAFAFAGCESPYKKTDAADKVPLRSVANDPSFQAFVGRLRTAVAQRDKPTLATMMAADFGYRWDPPPVGEDVFTFWDMNNLWPELAKVLKGPYEPQENYMKAPPQSVTDPDFPGYRVGLRLVGGSWKFAYFVPGGSS